MPQERIEKGKRVRACTICGRTFKRTEHCIRHERAHFRERPFSCRFCQKSYGRKDLLVRHERTLHADEWANAQLNASQDASARPARRRQSRNSWSQVHPLPQVLPQLESQYKEDLQTGMRINDETVIQYESFLPSPRVSSSDISDPELVTSTSDGMAVELPMDPNLLHDVYMPVGANSEPAPYQYIPTYPIDQRHAAYDSHMQPYIVEQFNQYQGFPIDPNLTAGVPQIDNQLALPDSTFSDAENVNILALFPFPNLDQQILIRCFDESFSGKSTLELLKNASNNTTPSSNLSSREPRRRGRPPRNATISSNTQPCITFTEDDRSSLLADLKEKFDCEIEESLIPDSQDIQSLLTRFFESFNTRLPLFHLPSFNILTTPPPLLLAICSIGVLFGHDKGSASTLRELTKQALQNVESTSNRSLWEVQCKLLLTAQAAFGGDFKSVNWAVENVGFIQREFSARKTALLAAPKQESDSWPDWISRESSKRLLLGMFIISGMLTLTYNISPCISTTEELKIEMPCEEHIWIAADEDQWRKASAAQKPPKTDIYTALTKILFSKDFDLDSESQWPAFAVTVLMHAVNVHMWHITQSTQSFTSFSADAKEEEQMKALCTSQTEAALSRCYMVLAHRSSSDGENFWDDVEGPLLFNGMAVLRSCYVRAFTGSGSFNRALLFNDDEQVISTAIKKYIKGDQVRTPFLSGAITQAFDGLLAPLDMVHKLSEKESVLGWSVEHALAMWDTALFYTKWVHNMETQGAYTQPDHEEKQNLEKLLEVLRRNDEHWRENQPIAASLARLFASFIDANWTWKVTCRMSHVLHELALVYENDEGV
ncbi:zinc finger protein, putative [Talaromyces stipitatus ATCC 10500]|uniref:Zinc finger protein, putative n=1 Tax=Talaromyces stipitatus (strain ATCC 10500 / CBS 375.48 / QM 6759 / NRRL 1006) TaxID=441959 RepID=B8MRM0_TALSN|nr:zinc finger protein, putative [Talaromyces stipitatus ATCC 10500]EED13177.1 zinc finger protein, putative [Talaromyces stipitatus ATCC 10500]